MILTDTQIIKWASDGGITPFNINHVNPASIDICLGDTWIDVQYPEFGEFPVGKLYKPSAVHDIMYSVLASFSLWKQHRPSAVLAVTKEYISIPDDMAAEIKLKTTPTRKGLGHPVADWIDPGFYGKLTLMLNAVNDIELQPRQRICQLVLHKLSEPVSKSYRVTGHYNGKLSPTRAWDEER